MSSLEAPTVYIPAHKPSMFWTVVGGYGMLLIFVGLVMLFIGREAFEFKDSGAEREIERIKIRDEVAAASKKAMEDGPAWLNKEKGVVHLPIDQAMALTIERLKIKKPRAANPIEAPAPAAAAAPASAAAPSPAPSTAPAPGTAPPAAPATPTAPPK